MRTFLLAVGVLGLAALFGTLEASSSARPVTSGDVSLKWEQVTPQSDQPAGRQRNGRRSYRYLTRG